MGSPLRITAAQRRARLALRHHIAPAARAKDVVGMVRDIVALHATDPGSVYLAARARLRNPEVAALERALYVDRVLVRMLGMRRTMFVVNVEMMPVIFAACTKAIAAVERRRTEQFLADTRIAPPAMVSEWLSDVEDQTLELLHSRGEALSTELSAEIPALATQMVFARGKAYEGKQSVASRVLPLLAADGRVVRGRPRGTWVSGQYRWATTENWLPDDVPELKPDEARVELTREWLRVFGPATVADLKWWSGWTLGQTRAALASIDLAEVDLDGMSGIVLADDLSPARAPAPHAALLPCLDPAVMGYLERGWFLGPHASSLFDRNGNAGPTVWWDGRVVGGWAQRKDGEVLFRLLEDIGADGVAAVEEAVADLAGWMGLVRVTPRFRTPLERELVK